MFKDVRFNGMAVTVRELTVSEVNEYLENTTEPPSTADLLLDRSIPEKVVRLATGLSGDEINGGVLPSDLETLWNDVEEVNPFLSRLMERLTAAGKAVIEDLPRPASKSAPAA
jgi:hypothetical protein